MDKIHCTIKRVINERTDVGAVLDVQYQPADESWEEVQAFLKKGPFALCFQSPDGTVTLRDITVSASAAPGLMIGIGQNEPSRLVFGPAWIERLD